MMKYTGRQNQSPAGFGLIEIMIALFLGVIIMLGVTEIATNNSKTTYELERAGRRIENAAYALRLLEGDLTNAAFWGEAREQTAGTPPPPICLDDGVVAAVNVLEEALGYPLQGGHIYEAPYNVDPYKTIACPPATFEMKPKPGTDYLAIRRASSCALGSTGCDLAGTNFHLQVTACFNADSPQDTERVKISNDIEGALDPNDALDATQRDCDPSTNAPIYRFLNRIYYVNDEDQLVRVELVGTGYTETPLVDDIEMLRFEYGLDTNDDGQEDLPADPDNPYPAVPEGVDAADGARWANVVRVTITLVVRSQVASGGFTDEKIYDLAKLKYDYSASPATKSVDWDSPTTYCANLPPRAACDVTIPAEFVNHRRQLFTRTVSLRNVAGRRE